jgi:hypothetical protein
MKLYKNLLIQLSGTINFACGNILYMLFLMDNHILSLLVNLLNPVT